MRVAILLLALLAMPASIHAAAVIVDKSAIEFTSTQMGVPIKGSFKEFTSDVRFDPKDPKKGRASITIHIDSIDAGSDEATVEVKRRPWFDVANHPKAEFVSGTLTPLGQDRYIVAGKLTIKGRSREVRAPFTVKKEKDLWLFEGAFKIDRLDFAVGEGAWSDTGTVANEVELSFRLYVPVMDSKK